LFFSVLRSFLLIMGVLSFCASSHAQEGTQAVFEISDSEVRTIQSEVLDRRYDTLTMPVTTGSRLLASRALRSVLAGMSVPSWSDFRMPRVKEAQPVEYGIIRRQRTPNGDASIQGEERNIWNSSKRKQFLSLNLSTE